MVYMKMKPASIVASAVSFLTYVFLNYVRSQPQVAGLFSDQISADLSIGFSLLAIALFVECLLYIFTSKKSNFSIIFSAVPLSFIFISIVFIYLSEFNFSYWQQGIFASIHTFFVTLFVGYYRRVTSDNYNKFEISVITFLLNLFGGFVGFIGILVLLTMFSLFTM